MNLPRILNLLVPSGQTTLVRRRRALLITSRVRIAAALFGAFTAVWIPIDLLIFAYPLGLFIGVLGGIATIVFGVLALSFRQCDSMRRAHAALAVLLAVPTAFFVISQPVLAHFPRGTPIQQVVAASYAFLPFVMIAGISVFPVTALEGMILSVPMLAANLLVAFLGMQVMPFATHLGEVGLLVVLAVVATLAGMSQLQFMMQLVDQASHDGLTLAYTRRIGEELLDLQFSLSQRNGTPFAIAFIDLDKFKAINDEFGHDEGDNAIRQAAMALRQVLRRADLLVRWGGEEFVVVMPNTDPEGARIAVQRLRDMGLGRRPDGMQLTASIGVAERLADGCSDWASLVETADHRMYAAKQKGNGRVIMVGEEELL